MNRSTPGLPVHHQLPEYGGELSQLYARPSLSGIRQETQKELDSTLLGVSHMHQFCLERTEAENTQQTNRLPFSLRNQVYLDSGLSDSSFWHEFTLLVRTAEMRRGAREAEVGGAGQRRWLSETVPLIFLETSRAGVGVSLFSRSSAHFPQLQPIQRFSLSWLLRSPGSLHGHRHSFAPFSHCPDKKFCPQNLLAST